MSRPLSLRARWIASVLAICALTSLVALGVSARLSEDSSQRTARQWLQSSARFSTLHLAQVLLGFKGQAALLARVPQVLSAFEQGEARPLVENLSPMVPPGHVSFWVAVSVSGEAFASSAPGCTPVVVEMLRRQELDLERGAFLLCGDAPAIGIAVPVGSAVRRGWLVMGELLGDAYVDELAKLSGTEVLLWGPRGQVAGTFRDQAGKRLVANFDSQAQALLRGLPREYFGKHWIGLPDYRGFGRGELMDAGSSRVDSFVYMDALDASAEELPVRLVLAIPAQLTRAGLRSSLAFLALMAVIGTGALMLALVLLLGRVSGAVANLLRAAEQVRGGNLDARVPVRRTDELGRLSHSFNQMVAQLRVSQARAIQSAKMGAVGQLAAGMAHELNNPLGIILGFAQALERRIPEGDPTKFPTQSIIREALRCKELVQSMLTFSRAGVLPVEPVDVNALVTQTLPLLEARAREQGVGVAVELTREPPVLEGSRTQLQQALLQLTTNALDAMPRGGMLTVRTELVEGGARIAVADTGGGIPEEIRARIFEPFFTTKPVGQGTGLGLSLVYEIVSRHHGDIEVQSRAGQGTIMVISLPGRESMPEAAA